MVESAWCMYAKTETGAQPAAPTPVASAVSDASTTPASSSGSTAFPRTGASLSGSTPFPGKSTPQPPPTSPPTVDVDVIDPGERQSPANEVVEEAALEVQSTADRGKILVSKEALMTGSLILCEKPVLAVIQATASPTVSELQTWVNNFAALPAGTRRRVLELHCGASAAEGGTFAALVGARGEKLDTAIVRPAGVSADELWRFLRIVECNTFGVETVEGMLRVELLLKISRLNHSCSPNALRGPGAADGTVEVRALRSIEAGEELTISYVDSQTLLSPAAARRERLSRWQFVCGCQRCAAPDQLRAFSCGAGPLCRGQGFVCASADGGLAAPCSQCGRCLSESAVKEAIEAEERVARAAPEAQKLSQIAAGSLNRALQERNGPAFESAVATAMSALKDLSECATANKQLAPSHFLIVGVAKAAATLRALLGDGLMAGRRKELAQDMWKRAVSELQEAMAAEAKAFNLPHDGAIADLIGLAGLYQRLDRKDDARHCLSDALAAMRSVYWACAPAKRESSEEMLRGVESAVATLSASPNEEEDEIQ